MRHRNIVLVSALFALACASSCTQHNPTPSAKQSEALTYIGATACKECHQKAYADWLQSDHFKAMLPATDSTVLGNFNDVTFTADGVTSRFFKRDGFYFIHTEGEDGQNHDFKVDYVFGHYPLQQYLISFPGGKMQATRLSWDSRENKWFNQYAGDVIDHSDWLHWTSNGQNWNTMCASCHSTNLQKNYATNSDTYHSTWSEVNVSCESCHGPGSVHASFMASADYKRGETIANAGLRYTKTTNNTLEVNSCAPCHARKADLSPYAKYSHELLDDYIPQLIDDEFYFADGQVKEEDYVYGSFVQSKMYHNDVRCTDCHNPHSGKPIATGNQVCLKCHEPEYNTPQHHFHEAGTAGAQCINCHMPVRTYMGNDHRRDHSFRVPRPDQSVAYGTPNACNQCHTENTAAWAAKAVVHWYGAERTYHFSDDLLPGSKRDEKSEKHLLNVLQDKTQPEIARATAVYYLGQLPASPAYLINALTDQHALVRNQALRSLQNYTPEDWLQQAGICLSDPVRAVRIAAANLYHNVPLEQLPPQFKQAFSRANAENLDYLLYQADFAVGNVLLGDYFVQEGKYNEAIYYYERGLHKDSLMNYARLNLAAAYNMSAQNQNALKTLYNAKRTDPNNGRIDYSLALLWAELNQPDSTRSYFENALEKAYNVPGIYYNYALLLLQEKAFTKAEELLSAGLVLHPTNSRLLYAMTVLYLQTNRIPQAKTYARLLKAQEPQNPEFLELYVNLDI